MNSKTICYSISIFLHYYVPSNMLTQLFLEISPLSDLLKLSNLLYIVLHLIPLITFNVLARLSSASNRNLIFIINPHFPILRK